MMEDKSLRPTVSCALDDGTLVELLYDPLTRCTALAVDRPGSSPTTLPALDLPSGERLVPYSATNNLIATECVLLPSAIGPLFDKATLVAAVQAFLHRYVDLSPTFEAIAAHYVLLSWVYDAFNELPYLRLRGDFGTGKTRALLAIGSLCYKPFFASGASTVSPIFHVLEAFGGTLVLDEADLRFSDATADLTKILNNGNMRGLPVLRTMSNRHRELNPQAFRVFGPKLIAMRQPFADAALESRFITEETRPKPLRPGIPIHVPKTLREEAQALRNQLLAWRFATHREVQSEPTRLGGGLSPRASQTVLSLLSVMDDPLLREAVCSLVGGDDAQLRKETPASLERLLIEATVAAFDREGSVGAAVGLITQLFNSQTTETVGHQVTARWIGAQLRKFFGAKPVKVHGIFALPHTERARFIALARRYGVPLSTPQSPEGSPREQCTAASDELAA